MHTLLALLLIVAIVVLALTVSGALFVRHAFRRLHRTVRARMAGACPGSALAVLSRPIAEQARAWSSPLRPPRPDRMIAAAAGLLLSARAWLPGPAKEVALVRRDLHRDVSATSRALSAARKAGRPIYDLECSVAMLAEQVQKLQLDLQIIAAEPDREVRARLLSAHAAPASLVQRTCANVRAAVLTEGSSYDEPALRQVVDNINDAVITADLRVRAYRELSFM